MQLTQRIEHVVPAAHHNGPEDSRCRNNHGHDWEVTVELTIDESQLNEYGWGVNFSDIKAIINQYDHKDLNEIFGDVPPSAENLAIRLYKEIHEQTGFRPDCVVVGEGNGNHVMAKE